MTSHAPPVRHARSRWTALGLALLVTAAGASGARAARGYVLPDHSDPRAGATLDTSPNVIRVWFEARIVQSLSTIRVEKAGGGQVDRADGHVDRQNPKLLEVTVPWLLAGKYRVFWSVVGATGRRSSGDFPFRVR